MIFYITFFIVVSNELLVGYCLQQFMTCFFHHFGTHVVTYYFSVFGQTILLFLFSVGLPDSRLPMFHFSCGVTAGMMASIITQPADVIKTHMQLYPKKFGRIRHAVIHVYEVLIYEPVNRKIYKKWAMSREKVPLNMCKMYRQTIQHMAKYSEPSLQ